MSKLTLQELASGQFHDVRFHIEAAAMFSQENRLLPIVDAIKSNFNEFLDHASIFLNGLKFGNYRQRSLRIEPAAHQTLIAKGYPELRMAPIKVPEGFSAKYQDYLNDVDAVMPALEALERTLSVTQSKIAQLMNEPDRLKAQTGIKDLEQTLTLVTVPQYDALLANYKNGTRSQVLFNQTSDSLSDFTKAYDRLDALNTRLAKIDMVKIQDRIHRLAELVKSLCDTVSSGETKEVSGNVAGQLSDLMYRMAVTATTLSVVSTGVGDLSDTARENLEALTSPH